MEEFKRKKADGTLVIPEPAPAKKRGPKAKSNEKIATDDFIYVEEKSKSG